MQDIPSESIKDIPQTIALLKEEEQKYYIDLALKRIPSKEGLSLHLFYLEEYSIGEISDITGWSASNVKVILFRARKNIYRELSKLLKIENQLMDNNFEDAQLQELLSKSKKEMPFLDFEENIMLEIYKENERNRSIIKDIKLSWLFFAFGFASGIALTSVFSRFNESILGLSPDKIVVPIQLILSLIFLFLLEKLIKISFFENH